MPKVKFYGTLRLSLGVESVEVPIEHHENIRDFLKKTEVVIKNPFLEKLIDDTGKLIPGSIILVNKVNIFHLSKLETEVKDADEIGIFPPGAGG